MKRDETSKQGEAKIEDMNITKRTKYKKEIRRVLTSKEQLTGNICNMQQLHRLRGNLI